MCYKAVIVVVAVVIVIVFVFRIAYEVDDLPDSGSRAGVGVSCWKWEAVRASSGGIVSSPPTLRASRGLMAHLLC